ncbi:MAG: type II CAAX endopeptidase family protein [Myxococcota bacterium]|nr:type II CAAX endopeptidase family protein [Myxococcota bacterium]
MIVLLALIGLIALSGVFGWYLRVLGAQWHYWEAWVAFFLWMFASALGFKVCPNRWFEFEMILASLFGGSAMSAFVLFRADGRSLGLNALKRNIFPIIVGVTIVQILISTLWVSLLQYWSPELPAQSLLSDFEQSTSLKRWSLFFMIVVWAPFIEELMIRGFFWGALKVGWKYKALITGLIFGFLHFDTPYSIIPLSAYGFMLGWLRWKSDSLWASTLSHTAHNLIVLVSVL